VIELTSFVIPVRNEAENIRPMLEALSEAARKPAEILIVYDEESDPTLAVVRSLVAVPCLEYRLIRNMLGRGPANALKAGFATARGDALVVMMADRSDDLRALAPMMNRFGEGYDLVAGSRYMPGGEQVGGPWLKGKLSRIAGRSLKIFGLPICDPTNSFKLYRTERLHQLSLESAGGFEINLEIIGKACRAGWRMTEVPSRWEDRTEGRSKFKLWRWFPRYLRWYGYTLGSIAASRRVTATKAKAQA
jgi:glycosyltransferase involved in cell wall biosynthesis